MKTKANETSGIKRQRKHTPKKSRSKRQPNSADVRNDIARIVNAGARKITRAVMEQAMTGQLAPAKYLFELAGLYPAMSDGSSPSAEDESFAETLLKRLDLPDKPVTADDEDEDVSSGLPPAHDPDDDAGNG